MGFKAGCFIGFFHLPEKTCQQKNVIPINRIANQYKNTSPLRKHNKQQ